MTYMVTYVTCQQKVALCVAHINKCLGRDPKLGETATARLTKRAGLGRDPTPTRPLFGTWTHSRFYKNWENGHLGPALTRVEALDTVGS